MNTDSGILGFTVFSTLLVPVLVSIVSLLLLYGVVRVAVARGMRDHQLWMEKHRSEYFDRHYQAISPAHPPQP